MKKVVFAFVIFGMLFLSRNSIPAGVPGKGAVVASPADNGTRPIGTQKIIKPNKKKPKSVDNEDTEDGFNGKSTAPGSAVLPSPELNQ